jgi:hypothetical protein
MYKTGEDLFISAGDLVGQAMHASLVLVTASISRLPAPDRAKKREDCPKRKVISGVEERPESFV